MSRVTLSTTSGGGGHDEHATQRLRNTLGRHRRTAPEDRRHGLRRPRHHGHHAGRAPGEAWVGLQGAVRRGALARQHASRRDAAQLSIFLGYARGGWYGGLLAGLCFVVPGFLVLLVLAVGYAAFGATPLLRGALYGLGPVMLGIYVVAIYRLGKVAMSTRSQIVIAVAAATAALTTPLGVAWILLLAGGAGLWLFHSRRWGTAALAALAVGLAVVHVVSRWTPAPGAAEAGDAPGAGLVQLATFLLKVGALTFGGGLTMIAFIQDRVVGQFQWLTPQEFIDGLALGQLTPGPVLLVAAYVGYKVAGIGGAAVGGAAAFLPSFGMMLALLPVFDRVRTPVWTRAALRGLAPGVIGGLAVPLVPLSPPAPAHLG